MCLEYKGITYPYAFQFNFLLEDGKERPFRIAISNYRDSTKDYTGLFLDNELKVFSNNKATPRAFYEIITDIVKITLDSEKQYAETHGAKEYPKPFMSVTDPDCLEVFEKCRKSEKSLAYYRDLMAAFMEPETMLEKDISEEREIDMFDSTVMIYFFTLIENKEPQIKNLKFTRT
jgi:hypothetical protein